MIYVLIIRETFMGDFIAGVTSSQQTADDWEEQEVDGCSLVAWPVEKDKVTSHSEWPAGTKELYNKFHKLIDNK